MDLNQLAINYSLKCNWKEAINVNKQILKDDPLDVDALNRLAKAHYENGDAKSATTTIKRVLKIEPTNKIAQKALFKYKYKKDQQNSTQSIESNFLEEPGKTKLTNLINVSSANTIGILNSGDEVEIVNHLHRVTVSTKSGKYIGKLPDDISARIRVLLKGGTLLKAIIKSADSDNVKVFIKEVSKGKGFENTNSFAIDNLEPTAKL